MAHLTTDIDLRDFDNDDIVDHVCDLIDSDDLTDREKKQLRNALGVQPSEPTMSSLQIITTQDQMKFELLQKYFNDFDYEELEDRLTVDLDELREMSGQDI